MKVKSNVRAGDAFNPQPDPPGKNRLAANRCDTVRR